MEKWVFSYSIETRSSEVVEACLERVGLSGLGHRQIGELSGGQKNGYS